MEILVLEIGMTATYSMERYFKTCRISLDIRAKNLRTERIRTGRASKDAQCEEVFAAYDLLTELIQNEIMAGYLDENAGRTAVASEVKFATILESVSRHSTHCKSRLSEIFKSDDLTDQWIDEAVRVVEESVSHLSELETAFS